MKKWMILALIGAMLLSFAGCGKEEDSLATEETQPDGIAVTYYHGEKHGKNLVSETGYLKKLTAQGVINLLIEAEAIPEGTRVRNFRLSQGIITLDLSGEFESGVQKLGSTGEWVMVGSLVNTFLTTYDAQGMELTTEGRVLATGHDVYDGVLRFFE